MMAKLNLLNSGSKMEEDMKDIMPEAWRVEKGYTTM